MPVFGGGGPIGVLKSAWAQNNQGQTATKQAQPVAKAPDMSGFQGQGGAEKWMQQSGGNMDQYNQQMGAWQNAAPPPQPTPPPQAPAPDMSGYIGAQGRDRWMAQSGGTADQYGQQMGAWRNEGQWQGPGMPPPPPNGQTGLSTAQMINGQRMYWTGNEWHPTPFQMRENLRNEQAATSAAAAPPAGSPAVQSYSPEALQALQVILSGSGWR